MPVLSVRVDDDTAKMLRRLARARRKTKSAVIRESVLEYARQHLDPEGTAETLYERMKPRLGTVKTAATDLSVDTGRRVLEILRRRSGNSK